MTDARVNKDGSKRVWITDFFTTSKKPKASKPTIHAGSKSETKSETKKSETGSETKSSTDTGTETKPETKTVTEVKSKTISEPLSETKRLKSETNADTATGSETGSETVAETGKSETPNTKSEKDYTEFCRRYSFDKEKWVASLSEEQKMLLALEIETLHITWLVFLHPELTKPYFLKLKKFLLAQKGKTVFPPPQDVYSWSHYTPLPEVKCLVMGQDPYHNYHQAHGLAFSVLEPTRPPPSLVNIYKALQIDFPAFKAPDCKELAKAGNSGGGNLTKWAKSGVLMLNACLTVEAHKANSHANQGWETFTEHVIKAAISYHHQKGFVIMAWGSPAQKRVAVFSRLLNNDFCVLKSVHPSPLSAHRGFFDAHVFRKCNDWLVKKKKDPIDWAIVPGNSIL